ncbi:glutaredoxin family protein [Haloferula sp. A504]|uniref:glutaredoxin family protein n=1 Tax=Haloferula sp. A504 TaxID=3373601 RepID=UPI0031C53119|nr:glutaredoxin [Verrucomicrobiaceae bacterium E54]
MSKTATLYRMATPDHLCPWGLKARSLLRRAGYRIEDHHLRSMEEAEDYKKENEVDETPQILIEGERIGGYDDLRDHLGKSPEPREGTSYRPVVAVFATTFLMAVTATYAIHGGAGFGAHAWIRLVELFIAFSMCVLAILKLRDLSSFTTQFLGYDLLSRRFVPYAYLYPFVEIGAGILMIGRLWTWVAAPGALFIGLVGGVSVFKAVYIDNRELKCACVGGNSSVPLGFISLTENVMMVLMAAWMMTRGILGS